MEETKYSKEEWEGVKDKEREEFIGSVTPIIIGWIFFLIIFFGLIWLEGLFFRTIEYDFWEKTSFTYQPLITWMGPDTIQFGFIFFIIFNFVTAIYIGSTVTKLSMDVKDKNNPNENFKKSKLYFDSIKDKKDGYIDKISDADIEIIENGQWVLDNPKRVEPLKHLKARAERLKNLKEKILAKMKEKGMKLPPQERDS